MWRRRPRALRTESNGAYDVICCCVCQKIESLTLFQTTVSAICDVLEPKTYADGENSHVFQTHYNYPFPGENKFSNWRAIKVITIVNLKIEGKASSPQLQLQCFKISTLMLWFSESD